MQVSTYFRDLFDFHRWKEKQDKEEIMLQGDLVKTNVIPHSLTPVSLYFPVIVNVYVPPP